MSKVVRELPSWSACIAVRSRIGFAIRIQILHRWSLVARTGLVNVLDDATATLLARSECAGWLAREMSLWVWPVEGIRRKNQVTGRISLKIVEEDILGY